MNVTFTNLLTKLGVTTSLEGYGSLPWQVCDESGNTCCFAEIRVLDADVTKVEAEIMLQRLNPTKDQKPVDIVLWMVIEANQNGLFDIKKCKLRNKDFASSVSGWDLKACAFFKETTRILETGDMPDIEKLIESIMLNNSEADDDEKDKSGGSGRNWGKGYLNIEDMNYQHAPGAK